MNKTAIFKEITKLENPYPSDYLIKEYRDFLQHRDYLPYYQFNPTVFDKLIVLTSKLWSSTQRINRLSMLNSLKRYQANNQEEFTESQSNKIFKFVWQVIKFINVLSPNQQQEAIQICNSLLVKKPMGYAGVDWLLYIHFDYPIFLNRILNFPVKSEQISKWANENLTKYQLIDHRAKLVSWILDEHEDFEIDLKIIANDFEYLNRVDSQRMKEYLFQIEANRIIEKELNFAMVKQEDNPYEFSQYYSRNHIVNPTLELSKRKYKSLMVFYRDEKSKSDLLDIDKTKEQFYNNIEITRNITMLWAVIYSRLDKETKFKIAQRYHTKDTNYLLFKLFKKEQDIEGLKWLSENIKE